MIYYTYPLITQGISNVALVSIALGYDNIASQQFLEAKQNFVPNEDKPNERYAGSCDAHMILVDAIATMIMYHQRRVKVVAVAAAVMKRTVLTMMMITCILTLVNLMTMFVLLLYYNSCSLLEFLKNI